MKRYWLFLYENYYPSGAMNDFFGDFDTVEECVSERTKVLEGYDYNYYQIFDIVEKVVVHMYEYGEEKHNVPIADLYKSNHIW